MAALTKRLLEVIDLEKPDLLHAHSPVLNVLPVLKVGRRLGIPVIYEIRAFWEDAAVDHGAYGSGSVKYKLVKNVETWACRKADQVAVICEGLKNDLIKRGIPAERLTVVANGINTDEFKKCVPDAEYAKTWGLEGKKVIGFIGSFYRYEGLDLLVDAFARLSSSREGILLLLVGGGPMDGELRKQIERLRIQGKVIMPGRLPHDRVPGVYALIDILAYPRYATRLTELVTPLKPLEAMAMGKAVVASDIGGHRELIQDGRTGLLFPAGSVSALAEVLERLIDDSSLRELLERAGTDWVCREHPWDKTTTVYSDIYSKALKSGPFKRGKNGLNGFVGIHDEIK